MAKLRDIPTRPPKILLYGEPGTGKTAFGLTLGEHLEVLDFEQGLATGLSLKDQFTEQRQSVEVSTFVDEDPTKATAFRRGKSRVVEIANQALKKKYPYKAVMLDSMTSIADAAVRQVMLSSGGGKLQPEIQHWNLAFMEIEQLLSTIRSTNLVLILTAHVAKIQSEDSVTREIDIPGKKLPNKVTRYFDEIWYTKMKPVAGGKYDYIVQTKQTGSIVSRSRLGMEDGFPQSKGLPEVLKSLGYDING